MMEGIRSWVMGVVAVGILVSICLGLSPGGKVQKVSRFCGGLLLFLAVVTPLTKLDINESFQEFQDYCAQLSESSDEQKETSGNITKKLVISQSEACIKNQAKTLGANVEVTVTCRSKDGLSIPSKVSIVGDLTRHQQQKLTRWIKKAFDLNQKQIQIKAKKAEGNK